MAAKEMTGTVENSTLEEAITTNETATEVTASEISAAWAKAMLQAVTDAARDPLRYVTDAIVPDGGE